MHLNVQKNEYLLKNLERINENMLNKKPRKSINFLMFHE